MYASVSTNKPDDSARVDARQRPGHPDEWSIDAHFTICFLSFSIDEARELAAKLHVAADRAEIATNAARAALDALAETVEVGQ